MSVFRVGNIRKGAGEGARSDVIIFRLGEML